MMNRFVSSQQRAAGLPSLFGGFPSRWFVGLPFEDDIMILCRPSSRRSFSPIRSVFRDVPRARPSSPGQIPHSRRVRRCRTQPSFIFSWGCTLPGSISFTCRFSFKRDILSYRDIFPPRRTGPMPSPRGYLEVLKLLLLCHSFLSPTDPVQLRLEDLLSLDFLSRRRFLSAFFPIWGFVRLCMFKSQDLKAEFPWQCKGFAT